MRRILTIAAALATMGVPAGGQTGQAAQPVQASLRVTEGRTAFKVGEAIRLELVFTTTQPGLMVEISGADDPSDDLFVHPETSVRRLSKRGGRDHSGFTNLTSATNVIHLAANYWVRFDTPGDYTLSIGTRRIVDATKGGTNGPRVPLRTNPITVRIDQTSEDDEQALIQAATRNLQSSITLKLEDQIRAAEDLAFLVGDAAALEKYRWYRRLEEHNIAGNARGLLWRGFLMSRNPGVILAEVERELADLDRPVHADAPSLAARLSVAVRQAPIDPDQQDWIPKPPGSTDPVSLELARYLAQVHESLERRAGQSKLLSAGMLLSALGKNTPDDVVRLIVDRFEDFPRDSRQWFVSGRWDAIRDPALAPALVRLLDEVEPTSRSYVYPALIDVAPLLAVGPLAADLLDPSLIVSTDLLDKMPAGALTDTAPRLLEVISRMRRGARSDAFRTEQKISALATIADRTLVAHIRDLYDAHPGMEPLPRARVLRYLLRWAPDEGLVRFRSYEHRSGDSSLVWSIAQGGTSPGLLMLLRDHASGSDQSRAELAVGLLARHGNDDDRGALHTRLVHWRLDRRLRLSNGEPLTGSDGQFESALVRALTVGAGAGLSPGERDRLMAECVTEACRTAIKGMR